MAEELRLAGEVAVVPAQNDALVSLEIYGKDLLFHSILLYVYTINLQIN